MESSARALTLMTPVAAVVIIATGFLATVTRRALANGQSTTVAVSALALATGIRRSLVAFGRGLGGAR